MQFTLRPWNINDLENLVKIADNPKIANNMMNRFVNPFTIEQGKQFISYAEGMNPIRIFAIDVNGVAIGAIGIHPQDDIYIKNAELGYWLAEEHWGKGITTEAIKRMLDYGFKTWDLKRIFARPFGTNIGSQRVLEKAGFTLEARLENTIFKNGDYTDELIYAIRK